HGDACATDVTRCEMSRVRETVRLRLIPPRDFDPTNPITKFLATASKIAPRKPESQGAPGLPWKLLYVIDYTFTPSGAATPSESGEAYAAGVPEGGSGLVIHVPKQMAGTGGTITLQQRLVIVPDPIW